MPADRLPDTVRALDADGWTLVEAAPVVVHGHLTAAFVRYCQSSEVDPLATIRTNVVARIRNLAEVTALLYNRWHDRKELVAAATTDQLTGLANRDAFTAAMADRPAQFAVLYIDVDRFKEVNDEWGHAAGDQVLIEVARRIETACRPDDVVARFGGDEFVVMLRDVDDVTARRVGERIVHEVAAPLAFADGPATVSVSVGLAPTHTIGDAVEAADRAMLNAKRQGRGRVVTA